MKPKVLLLFAALLFQQLAYCQKPPTAKAQTQLKTNSTSSTPTSKTEPKLKAKSADSFVCPDPKAKKACDSYHELKKAQDANLRDFFSRSNSRIFVCFRQNVDEFFLVGFEQPTYMLERHYDKDLGKRVINDNASDYGYVNTTTFNNGVEDGKIVPSFDFEGTWTYRGELLGSYFKGAIFNKRPINTSQDPVVTIDEYQFKIDDYQYSNSDNKTIHYNLTIQKSTGRFTETFLMEPEKFPSINRTGRCLAQTSSK
jgi:hypothetical protein